MRYVFAAALLCGALVFSAPRAEAYPGFIAYGYTSCLTCHFNPLGNGPLSDYGRALSATTISGKPFYAPDASDDELGEESGFLGRTKIPEWFRPSAQYRSIEVASGLPSNGALNYYIMKADLAAVVKFVEDRYIVSGTLGYIADPKATSTANADGFLISREHYVGARVTDAVGLYAGLMDVAYGLHIADHTAYSRSKTNLAQNDQVHGVLAHYGTEKFETAAHVFAGNLYQDSRVRPKGAALTFEVEPADKVRTGASFLYSKNDYRRRIMGSTHIRTQLMPGHSLIGELGFIGETPVNQGSSLGAYLFLQSMHRLLRGFHILGTAEYYSAHVFSPDQRLLRGGPSIDWFPLQRCELRADLVGLLSLQPGSHSASFNAQLQANFYF